MWGGTDGLPLTHGGWNAGAPWCQCGHGPCCHKRGRKLFLLIPPPAALWPEPGSPACQRAGTPRPPRRSPLPLLPHSPRGPSTGSAPGPWARRPSVQAALPGERSTASVYWREPSPCCRTNPSWSPSPSSGGGPPVPTAPGRRAQAGRLLLQQGCSSSLSPSSGMGHPAAPGTRSRSKGSSSRKQLSSSVRQPRISADISRRTGRGSLSPGRSGVQEGTQRAPPPPPQAGRRAAPETTPGHSGQHPQPCPARASLDSTPGRSLSSSAPPHQPTLAVAARGIPWLCGLPEARLLEGSLTPAPSRCSRPWLPPTGRADTGIWGDGQDHRWWLSGPDGRRRSDHRGMWVCSVAVGATGEGRRPAGGFPRPQLEPTPSNLSTRLPPSPQ